MHAFLNLKVLILIGICQFDLLAGPLLVIKAPVADLVSQPLGEAGDNLSQVRSKYAGLSAGWRKSKSECLREHQGLFNEQVEMIDENEFEVCVSLKNCQGLDPEEISVWGLRENFTKVDELVQNAIPAAIDYAQRKVNVLEPVASLVLPFYDSVTKQIYSAGTRFKVVEVGEAQVRVELFDYVTGCCCQTLIPRASCYLSKAGADVESCIADFVMILRNWAQPCSDGQVVPFNWGGCSFIGRYLDLACQSYDRAHLENSNIHTGFDASGLVLRASQICGIPYYCRNSAKAANVLTQLPVGQLPVNGDIIATKGFIVVVSDVAANKLIRAAGVSTGYGRVVENTLQELFDGICTYQDLVNKIEAGEPVKCLNRLGEVRAEFNDLKIFSMQSAWKQ